MTEEMCLELLRRELKYTFSGTNLHSALVFAINAVKERSNLQKEINEWGKDFQRYLADKKRK